MGGSELTINVVASGKPLTLTLAANSLVVKRNNHTNEVPIRQVLQTQYTQDSKSLQVSYIARPKPKAPFALVRLEGTVQGESSLASDFAERVTNAAYNGIGVPRERRLKVIVNPHGGVRDGVAVFMKKVEPVFRAACCVLDVQHTTHSGHAYEIAKDLSLDYDAVVSVSGDGLIHEILNGFAHHQHPTKVFATPIAPIPTGSGNGLALNLLGLADGFDVVCAALNVVKGLPMKIDLFSFVQKGKRTISFMSQSMGLMAELDIGTDNLRWMGDTRFMVGLLRGLIPFKPCPVELSYKVASQDKNLMAEECCQRQKDDRMRAVPTIQEVSDDPFPDLQVDCDSGEWTKFEEPLLYVYCGKGPYVGRDFMAFPASLPDDGLIDIVAQVASSRTEVITEISAGAKGGHFWKNSCHYIKAHAYKVKPLVPKGALSVDGESFPFEPFHVEVHRELGTVLTPHGYYAAEFPSKPV